MNKKILGILGAFALYTAILIAGAKYGVTWDWYTIPSLIAVIAIMAIAKLKEGN